MSSSPVSIPRTSPSASMPLNSATGHVVLGTSGKVVQPMALVTSTPVQAPSKSTFSLFLFGPSILTSLLYKATGIARAVSPAAGGIRNIQYNLGGITAATSPPTASGSSRTLPPPPASTAMTNNDASDLTLVIRLVCLLGNRIIKFSFVISLAEVPPQLLCNRLLRVSPFRPLLALRSSLRPIMKEKSLSTLPLAPLCRQLHQLDQLEQRLPLLLSRRLQRNRPFSREVFLHPYHPTSR